jgi:hypothetical protein
MALTPEEFKQKMDKALDALNTALPNLIDERALNQKALMRARVTQEGLNVDASGNEVAFPDYSARYEKRRIKKGLNVTPNRLVFTGDMLRKLNITKREIQNGKYTVTLGGTDQFAQNKINYNSEHYGDVLRVSKAEEKIMMDAYLQDVADIVNEELGS